MTEHVANMDMDAFFLLHRDIPREGPGSDDATCEAIRRLLPLPPQPQVIDMGCGPGRQTLVLARELETHVLAVDFHEPFLAQLRRAAEAEGLADRVITRCVSFHDLEEPPGSFDLIWSEGSIFILGFANGLRRWRPLLCEGGLLVASEAAWFTDDPPKEAFAFWNEMYPAITSIDGNVELARGEGFEVFDHFMLPSAAWWDEYLTPLEARAMALKPQSETDPALAAVLADQARETEICRKYGDSFGYVFYLMRRVD
jgi:serine/threonine-protein kinase HipA